jgi:serine/threonine protein kinase
MKEIKNPINGDKDILIIGSPSSAAEATPVAQPREQKTEDSESKKALSTIYTWKEGGPVPDWAKGYDDSDSEPSSPSETKLSSGPILSLSAEEHKEFKNILTESHIPFNIHYKDLSFPEGKMLGKGGQGTVRLGLYDGKPVAVKTFPVGDSDEALQNTILSEAKIMASIKSDFVTDLQAVCLEKDKYCLVMEYMPEGDLHNLLEQDKPMSASQLFRLALDIAQGVNAIHARGIIHRDLKSLNVLLYQENGELRAKITDFGLSILKRYSIQEEGAIGSVPWLAPEIAKHNDSSQYSEASDVYSLGMVLFELVSKKVPYFDLAGETPRPSPEVIQRWIVEGRKPWENLPKDCPTALVTLIRECCDQDPKNRPTTEMVIEKLELLYTLSREQEDQHISAPVEDIKPSAIPAPVQSLPALESVNNQPRTFMGGIYEFFKAFGEPPNKPPVTVDDIVKEKESRLCL